VYNAAGDPVGAEIGDGLRYNPTIFSGAWMFESVDVGNGVLTVRANPYFPGTWDGYRPRIERVIWRFTPIALLVDALATGEAHVMIDIGAASQLQNAMNTLVDGGTHTFINYEQLGQRLIQFHTDVGPTQFREVRQAIAFMIDRHRINEEAGRGFSSVAHGPFTPAWWWYQEAARLGLYDRLHIYDLNLARAIELLVADGWIYDAAGNPYVGDAVSDPNNIRHKWVDEWHYGTKEDGSIERYTYDADGRRSGSNRVYTGERVLMPFIINWMVSPTPSDGRTALELQFPENLALSGGRLVTDESDAWGSFLQGGYRQQRYEMFYLGVGFNPTWAPWSLMSLDWIPNNNWGQVDNPVTREFAERFRPLDVTTEEGREAFALTFIDYMEHLTYEVYSLPTRFSLHFDFIPTWLGGWFNTGLWQLPEAITRAYIIE